MNLLIRKYKVTFIFPLLIFSCYTYKPIVIKSKLKYPDSLSSGHTRKFLIKKTKKYLAIIDSSSPIAEINNRGVKLALSGKFRDAETLFSDVLKEDNRISASYNNLGIIYELFGMRKKAFKMYSAACMLEPDNRYFLKNFFSITDSGKR